MRCDDCTCNREEINSARTRISELAKSQQYEVKTTNGTNQFGVNPT